MKLIKESYLKIKKILSETSWPEIPVLHSTLPPPIFLPEKKYIAVFFRNCDYIVDFLLRKADYMVLFPPLL